MIISRENFGRVSLSYPPSFDLLESGVADLNSLLRLETLGDKITNSRPRKSLKNVPEICGSVYSTSMSPFPQLDSICPRNCRQSQ